MQFLSYPQPDKNLYETDYDAWLAAQINGLQQGDIAALDIPHLIEELEGLSKSNERELESYLIRLFAHLLKWEYQPSMRGSWEASITNSRDRIERLLDDQKSLRSRVGEFLPNAYKSAIKWAPKETKLRTDLFPPSCPYSVEQLLDESWLPLG